MAVLTPSKVSLSEVYTVAAYSSSAILLSPKSARLHRASKASAGSPLSVTATSLRCPAGTRNVAPCGGNPFMTTSNTAAASTTRRPASMFGNDSCTTSPIAYRRGASTPTKINLGLDKSDIFSTTRTGSTHGTLSSMGLPSSSSEGSLLAQFQRQMHLTPKKSSPKDGLAKLAAFPSSPSTHRSYQSPIKHQSSLPPQPHAQLMRTIHHSVGSVICSPGTRRLKSKITTYDRFIPNRDAMENSSHFSGVKGPIEPPKHMDADAIAYQEQLAKACGIAIDQRILAFNIEPPGVERQDLRTTWNRPLRAPNVKLAKRRIPTIAEKVLDAPGLIDDFYLSLLDWSSKNQLAIALDKTVYIWNADTGSVQEFCQTADDNFITSLQWTADGSYLAVGTDNGDAQIWDLDSNSKIRTMRGRNSRVGVLSWDKHILSSGSRDGSIWHHDVRIANHKVAELLGHSSEVCGLKWRPDGQMLASGGNDNLVNIWDIRSTTPKFTKTEHMAAVKALAWCPWQLNLLATGGGTSDQNVHFWNTTTAGKISTIHAGSQVTSIIWSREYKELLTSHGFPNNHLSIWSYPSLNKVADLSGHDSRVLHTALSPDGQTVASTASDENLKFWKAFESRKNKTAQTKRGGDDVDEVLAKTYSRMTIR